MQVLCPQCGAPSDALTESRFHRCPYCSSSFMVRDGKGIVEYTFRHQWDDRHAWSALAAYLETGGLNEAVRRDGIERIFFPFWLHTGSGESRRLVPALSRPFPALAGVTLPAGDMVYLSEKGDYPEPSVPLSEAMGQLRTGGEPGNWSLVHIPLYLLEYAVRERSLTAVVSGVDGKVFATESPTPSGTGLPVSHLGMILSFALLLTLEGLFIRNHLARGVAFLLSFAALYPLYLSLLKRELYR